MDHQENHERRKVNPTEKGRSYQLGCSEKARTAAGAALRRRISKVSSLVERNCEDMSILEQERDILDSCREKLDEANTRFCKELSSQAEVDEACKWLNVRDREYFECRTEISKLIQGLEENYALKSMSVISSRSSSSSVRSRRAKAAARAACLQVEMQFIEREAECRKIQIGKELAKAKAEEEVMRKMEEEDKLDEPCAPSHSTPITPVIGASRNPPFASKSLDSPNNSDRELNSVVEVLVEQHKMSLLPTQQPPVFAGSYFEYPSFISAFEALIECRVADSKQRLHYLHQYTSGAAKDAIRGLITLNAPDSYDKAKSILKERFGHPHRVAQAYKEKLNGWPTIKDGDCTGLQKFSDFLVHCEEAMKTMEYMRGLDSEDTLKIIESRLPNYSGVRWCRHANKVLKSEERLATFHDMVEFVKEEATLATDPVFSPTTLRELRANESPSGESRTWRAKKNTFKNSSSFSTSVFASQGQSTTHHPMTSADSCPLCSQSHNLDDCPDFKKQSLEERKNFIKSRGLCFGCLRPGHVSKGCMKRMKCKTCSKPHPTALHENKSPTPRTSVDQATSSCTSTCSATGSDKATTNTMIVPVYLHHQSNPDLQVMVYALHDPASNGTFIREDIVRELQVDGVKTQLQLNTMHGTEVIPTRKVDGLFVSRVDKEFQIKLPKAFTREEIPSKRDEIPRPESAAQWPHLHRIASKIHPYDADLAVGLLIGSNCPSAIKPKEVVPGGNNDPYAIRTALGWGIIGPITQDPQGRSPDISCNRIAIKEVGSEDPSYRSFVFETNAKEIITTAAVRRMFEADFNEAKNASVQPLSMEDRLFMAKAKEGIVHRPDGHYEMPLPFRDQHPKLPNNAKVAAHRLQQLKFRFSKDKKYKKDYTTFMSDMIKNNYAEKVPMEKECNDGQTWYIPHHGVYHPQKPDKIRVVFDCSAQFQGESLNKHLLSGPDLTNKLIRVLTRFRQETVALMSDIEAMFYQVQVSEECRDFLRFLWWEDGDTSREPTRYRMRFHLFGATSSPSCCNFAL